MVDNWAKQESQLGRLTIQAHRYLTTFRWLWIFNLAAAIIGVATQHYWLMVVAAGSSFTALIGVGFARRGSKIVSEATVESHRIQNELECHNKSDSLDS